MSTRHSFLSTTGLIRSPSSASIVPPPLKVSTNNITNNKKLGKPVSKASNGSKKLTTKLRLHFNAGVIPLGPTFIVWMGIAISILFITAVSFAFIGAEDELVFKDLLNDIAEHSPGIVLIGDNVDVDIDEPAITIRWSILACGSNYTLAGSEGTHGSSSCGIPSMALYIYVDSEEDPTAMYDPTQLPFTSGTSQRPRIQNLHQFDSDHVLDVHEARLYPFDTYHLTSTIRAVNPSTNATVPIIRLPTIVDTSSFIITSSDTASYVVPSTSDTQQDPSRDLDMGIQRPGEARFFALILFGINWMLAHSTIAYVALAYKSDDTDRVAKYLAFSVITMLVIPQVRNTMPDAPGLDGILIDQIGFFSQMLVTGICVITLLGMLARRELAHFETTEPEPEFTKERPAPISKGLHRLRGGSSTSIDFRHIRNLSKTLGSRVQVVPPSPIAERMDNSPYPAFESGTPGQRVPSRNGTHQWGRAQRNTPNSSSRSLHTPNIAYSEWIA